MLLLQRVCLGMTASVWALVASTAWAGSWSELPEAVSRLQRRADDRAAEETVLAAERSVLAEAEAGRLQAVVTLVDAFAELISPLADGDLRLERLQRRVAEVLVAGGDRLIDSDPMAAGVIWALAASYYKGVAEERLAGLLLPPQEPTPGQVWNAMPDGVELVYHAPLSYRMGCTAGDRECREDDEVPHWTSVAGMWIERYEVTNRRYQACVDAGHCSLPSKDHGLSDPERGDEPVTGVSWEQAEDFATWLGRDLPSEAEWERAARGNDTSVRFPWGNARSRSRANLMGVVGADAFAGVAPVGSFPQTGYGLSDIAGNVWEWCGDDFIRGDSSQQSDSRSGLPVLSVGKAVRGSSWRRSIELSRVSARYWEEPAFAADDLGFRCVLRESVREDVGSYAQAVFPLPFEKGNELESAALDPGDRRYLERRALTWLMLEGRPVSGLPYAANLLRRDRRDPIAMDLMSRVEDRLLEDARHGDAEGLATVLEPYRRIARADPSLFPRAGVIEERVAALLTEGGTGFLRRGGYDAARRCFELALRLRPGDPQLKRLFASCEPAPGAARVWNGDSREMVWIPGGTFRMGAAGGDPDANVNEYPARRVEVEGFWLDRAEVTNAEYRACVDAGACSAPSKRDSYDDPNLADHPVVWVDWYQAKTYARWAGKRLPSEVERERAARLGIETRYPWGDDWQDELANAYGALGRDRWAGSSPVGSFGPDRWGLVDMVGNAAEWVEDVYHSDYRGAPGDGGPWDQVSGPEVERKRLVRGGSFMNPPQRLRVSYREDRLPEYSARDVGFRCAADR
jgi:sulfatase modifying factor 1